MPELPVSESATCFFDLIELNVLLIFGIMFRKRIGRAGRHPQIMPHVISAMKNYVRCSGHSRPKCNWGEVPCDVPSMGEPHIVHKSQDASKATTGSIEVSFKVFKVIH
jgi:hypothetical protein